MLTDILSLGQLGKLNPPVTTGTDLDHTTPTARIPFMTISPPNRQPDGTTVFDTTDGSPTTVLGIITGFTTAE